MCHLRSCPGYVPANETGDCTDEFHGTCDTATGICTCRQMFQGDDCSTPKAGELADSRTETIRLMWGVSGYDRATGIVKYDSSFDLSDPKAQVWIRDICLSFHKKGAFHERYGTLPGTLSEDTRKGLKHRRLEHCVMIVFEKWLAGRGHGFPISDETEFWFAMQDFALSDSGRQYVEQGHIGLKKDWRVRYVQVFLKTGINQLEGVESAHLIYQDWENHVAAKVNSKDAPLSANKALQVSNLWNRAETEVAAIQGTVSAFIISNACAFGAIFLFTGDIVIAFQCTLAIIAIVCCLMGYMIYVMEWSFGAIEAISVTVFVGFSVDYCLHLANSYSESDRLSRYGKARDALVQTGVSVVSASITTIGASCFLFWCKIQVFKRFGKVICANTFLSIMYALFFLSPMLIVYGTVHARFMGCGASQEKRDAYKTYKTRRNMLGIQTYTKKQATNSVVPANDDQENAPVEAFVASDAADDNDNDN